MIISMEKMSQQCPFFFFIAVAFSTVDPYGFLFPSQPSEIITLSFFSVVVSLAMRYNSDIIQKTFWNGCPVVSVLH